jgi:hypothetical protein
MAFVPVTLATVSFTVGCGCGGGAGGTTGIGGTARPDWRRWQMEMSCNAACEEGVEHFG